MDDFNREVLCFLMLGSPMCVLLAFLEGRKSDAILRYDLGPPKGEERSKWSSDGAPERDKRER